MLEAAATLLLTFGGVVSSLTCFLRMTPGTASMLGNSSLQRTCQVPLLRMSGSPGVHLCQTRYCPFCD